MQEDAGKTKLKLDFESMDLSTLKGKAGIAESAQTLKFLDEQLPDLSLERKR